MATFTIANLAAAELFQSVEDRLLSDPDNAVNQAAFSAVESAIERKRGRGSQWLIEINDATFDVFQEELTFRLEMNGGLGNPYGVENIEQYARQRAAMKKALNNLNRLGKEL